MTNIIPTDTADRLRSLLGTIHPNPKRAAERIADTFVADVVAADHPDAVGRDVDRLRTNLSAAIEASIRESERIGTVYKALFVEAAGGSTEWTDDALQTDLRRRLVAATAAEAGDAWDPELSEPLGIVYSVVCRFIFTRLRTGSMLAA